MCLSVTVDRTPSAIECNPMRRPYVLIYHSREHARDLVDDNHIGNFIPSVFFYNNLHVTDCVHIAGVLQFMFEIWLRANVLVGAFDETRVDYC